MKLRFLALLLVVLCGIFSACESVDEFCPPDISEEQIASHTEISDSVLLIRRYPKQTLSKGYLMPNDDLETSTVTSLDGKYTYKVLKVYRRNSNRFFFIMMENLDCPYQNNLVSSKCWAYGNKEYNVKTYGRLYTWDAAKELSKNFSMKLGKYDASGTKMLNPKMSCKARLMTKEDVLDLLECDAIGNFPYNNAISLNSDYFAERDYCYYDAFVFGIEDAIGDVTKAYHSLGGMRDMYYNPNVLNEENHFFYDKNVAGHFWTSEKPYPEDKNIHIPLHIQYGNSNGPTYEFAAFWNAGWNDKNGFSVRYVFEPIYSKK